ncbi:SMP-30/gluconolactonase/LRE family protein [Ohtaekwangia koreensis]|uniref:Sugar lactone lactonase YvrE n=1 Tax=Ohtaekwangia koreensis TaxID=688867 RepID=A0A1T5K295_9BACT|nr:hypothetical protein [Ohtaekwangia koreensis]SKC57897.1 hypothetical protein SAMN05660236_1740 [Ohtaekwangia koreensis]
MKNYFAIIAVLLFSIAAHAQSDVITSGLLHPESIITDGKFLYTTLIGKALAPTAKDGDGAISKLDLAGKPIDLNFNKAVLNAPKGTTIVGNILYVADVDRVVGFDLQSGEKVDEVDLSAQGTQFLNDLTLKGDSVFFVSATDIGKIFKVTISTHRIEALNIPKLIGPNGLLYDAKTDILYVAGLDRSDNPMGELGMITGKSGYYTYTTLTDARGMFDGIQMLDANTLIVSDWVTLKERKTRLLKINIKEKTYVEIEKNIDAADILYDKKQKRFLLPALRDGNIVEYKFK